MSSHFYSMLSRMKYIERWALMRNTQKENLSEHSLETAFIAHALAVIKNRRLGGNVNAERVALIAMFHDTTEILTGDLPTPIKYYSDDIRNVYKKIETVAGTQLTELLPEDLREDFINIYNCNDEEINKIIKAADKISALIKCVCEKNAGNNEFLAAEKATRASIEGMRLPEADIFLAEFMESFTQPLDSITLK
ncbi:MAG: 5'-deoxynucleotidase [Clostridia bacterium]|nr:5'-deoxynucleotidase [Clostridia bacterium]MBQ5798310.1 5'-deoxynucleotidase [Clostridia bacterium]MEE1278300.1 5'-deoxynucleotidase [Acutalibacteraceae bacterium]